ncbi:hypothetical protein EYF80_040678 [Liparis tanakae]|uniref:Uncharacterized protein n=1 Tax=Liparis tanakae TaxID=230148 RepID=A0A4Z2G6E0_9TELE|nr:hypothetical protein EYF80_040678 [Liparis tanakae]
MSDEDQQRLLTPTQKSAPAVIRPSRVVILYGTRFSREPVGEQKGTKLWVRPRRSRPKFTRRVSALARVSSDTVASSAMFSSPSTSRRPPGGHRAPCEDESVLRTSIMVLVDGKVSATDGRLWYQPGKLLRKNKAAR